MYVWTQKGVDDYAIRHPHVKLKRNPRKVGGIAMYDGQPLKSGEIQRAYTERGLIESVSTKSKKKKKSVSAAPRPWYIPDKLVGSNELPKKRDLVIWREIHDFCAQGYTIVEISLKCNMSVSKLETFVRVNRKRFEEQYGKIRFKRLKKAS